MPAVSSALLLLALAGGAAADPPPPPPGDEAPPTFYNDDTPAEKPLSRSEAVQLYACTRLPSCGNSLPLNLSGQLKKYVAAHPDVVPEGQAYYEKAKADYEAKQARDAAAADSNKPKDPDAPPTGSPVGNRDAQTGDVQNIPPSAGGDAPGANPNSGAGASGEGGRVPPLNFAAGGGGGGAGGGRSAQMDQALSENKGIDGKAGIAQKVGAQIKNAFGGFPGAAVGGMPGDGGGAGAAGGAGKSPSPYASSQFAAADSRQNGFNQQTASEIRSQVPAQHRENLIADYAGNASDRKFTHMAPTMYRDPRGDADLKTFAWTKNCRPPDQCNPHATYAYSGGQLVKAETLNKMPASAEKKAGAKDDKAAVRDKKDPKASKAKLAALWAQIGESLAKSRAASAKPGEESTPEQAPQGRSPWAPLGAAVAVAAGAGALYLFRKDPNG